MRYLPLLISLLFLSCGTRRTELETSKTKISASSSTATDIDIKNDITSNVAVSSKDHSKEMEKDIEVIEEFNDNGQLKKRTTRARSRQQEKTSQQDSTGSLISKSTAGIKQSEKSSYDSLSKAKEKKAYADKTVATNVGGAGWLYGIIITIVIILLFYSWLRKPVKKDKRE